MEIVALIILLSMAGFVAKLVYDVQKSKRIKSQTKRFQHLAGIQPEEPTIPVVFVEGQILDPTQQSDVEVTEGKHETIY